MKSMALSILPSRKIHAIVSAAHCVFKKLNELSMLENSKPPGAGKFFSSVCNKVVIRGSEYGEA